MILQSVPVTFVVSLLLSLIAALAMRRRHVPPLIAAAAGPLLSLAAQLVLATLAFTAAAGREVALDVLREALPTQLALHAPILLALLGWASFIRRRAA